MKKEISYLNITEIFLFLRESHFYVVNEKYKREINTRKEF